MYLHWPCSCINPMGGGELPQSYTWRLNNTFFLNKDNISQLKKEIVSLFYFNSNTTKGHIVWDTFKAFIRRICIKIGAWNKKNWEMEINYLKSEIARLEKIQKGNHQWQIRFQLEQRVSHLKLVKSKHCESQILFVRQKLFQHAIKPILVEA